MPCKQTMMRVFAKCCVAAGLVMSALVHAQDAFQQGLDAYLQGDYQAARELWRPAAEAGDAVAAFNIGVLYAQGLGVEADPVEAVRWYRQSALAGYPNAQFNLGAAYYNGKGTEVSTSQAASWWAKAAEQDHPEALYNLGTLYRRGDGVERDVRRARSLFEKAASLGDARARQALADLGPRAPEPVGEATDGAGVDPAAGDVTAAVEADEPDPAEPPAAPAPRTSIAGENPDHWTVQVFAGPDQDAARQFGRDHELGGELRIYQAEIEGKTWFKGIYGSFADKAAAQAAEAELARKLSGSDPWVRSFRAVQTEAVAEHSAGTGPARETTDQSGTASQQSAVQPREDGPEDGASSGDAESAVPEKAVSEQERDLSGNQTSTAAPTEDSDQTQMALNEAQQAFGEHNYKTAFEVWRPLAEKGVSEAQYSVGFMYESGRGVDRDYGRAFQWYQLAAQQGHVKSQYKLGMLYRSGQGVAQNDALGLYWIQSAADRGDERAADYLKNLN